MTGNEGLRKAEQVSYDAILLDLNLPDISGEEVCTELRRRGLTTPVIVLTGRDLTADKVSLLDMGADDYMTKPFNLTEVSARLRAVMRRVGSSNSKDLVVGDLVLDPAGRTLWRKGKPITMRRKEFDLFEYMMRHAGQTLTRAMILEHVWEMSEDLWANVVDVHIKHLRDKIDRPFGTQLIKTVHGVGYKLDISEGA
jgi:two-component system OmpR family response regulator